jgi:hypothetical protein
MAARQLDFDSTAKNAENSKAGEWIPYCEDYFSVLLAFSAVEIIYEKTGLAAHRQSLDAYGASVEGRRVVA